MIRFFTRLFVCCIVGAGIFPVAVFSQTNPTPQSLPYSQDFSSLTAASTTYPANWIGWQLSTSASTTSYPTNAPTADRVLLAGSASSTAGGVYNYTSKLGFLTTGSLDVAVAMAINTTGSNDVSVAYDVMTIRNPYDGSANTRIHEVSLQYRVGTTGAFTTITGYEYQNNTTLQTGSGVVTPQKNETKTVLLPSTCNNQPIVQLRWASRMVTGGGSRPGYAIDNVNITAAGTAVSPSIVLNNNGSTAVQFPATATGTTSTAQTYTVNATNLTAPLIIGTSAPFSISSDGATFSTSLSFAPDGSGTVTKTIYTKFSPTTGGAVTGTITNSSTGATSKTITLGGEGIDPNNLSFNFNTCTNAGVPGGGFLAYNVVGPQVWNCTTFGNNSTNGVNINGYSSTAINNEDWLISPPLKIGTLTTPVLSFYSKGEYSGPTLQLLASTDYDGSSNPNSYTWTPLNGNFLTPSGGTLSTFNFSDNINLSAYKAASKLYIAFKYVSDTIAGAARWTLDDININDRSTLFSVSPTQLFYGETSVGTSSAGQAVLLQSLGHKDVTVTAPAEFQVSLNNTTFANSILIDSVTAKAGTTFYVKFAPTTKVIKQSGLLHFTADGVDTSFVALSGSSYPKSETLDIACYNMSFFGAGSNNDASPTLRNLQKTNLEAVYNRLNADIIGVEEVSSDSVFNKLVSELPSYAGFLSPKWSYFWQPFDASQPGFPPQKIGFIYNTKTVKLIDSHVIDGAQYDSVRAGTKTAWTDYPTGDPTSFWSSGRLPILATFDVTIGGITKRIRMIDIHAKAIGDVASYNRRVYDARVLKDTLDTYYKNDNVIIVGDYNDRLVTSIYLGTTVSPYAAFVNDKANYKALTYSLDSAGRSSFVGSTGMIDQIVCSNELIPNYIPNSTDIEPANTYISPYTATTASDHLPVYSRFVMNVTAPIAFTGCPNINLAVARPGYNTYNNEPITMYNVDTTTGAATAIVGGPLLETNTNKNMDLNGVGLNSNDKFLYGVRDTGNALTAKALLYRIGANYSVQQLGTIAPPALLPGENASAVNPAAGAFDTDGNYYFTAVTGMAVGAQGTPTNYYIGKLTGLSSLLPDSVTLKPTYTKIDFSGANCANISANLMANVGTTGASAGTGIQDLVYSSVYNRLYLYTSFQSPLGSNSYKGQLLGINPSTGVASCYTATSPSIFGATNNEVAGISSTANGSLMVFTTAGDMYKTIIAPSGDFTGAVTKMGASGIPSAGAIGSIRGDLAGCGFGKAVALPSVINPSLPQGVIAYPNPARGFATISTTSTLNNATVSLIGLAGNVISQTSGVSGNTFQLNLANTASGVYMVEINQNGNITRVKIVKE